MKSVSLTFTIFVLICFYHNSSAEEREKCKCDIFQLSKTFSKENRTEITNFTKQSGEINGRPFYFKITAEEQMNIVWWNETVSSLMLQNYARGFATPIAEVKNNTKCPNFSNTEDWTTLSNNSNGVEIRSRCLTDRNKCLVKGEFAAKSIISDLQCTLQGWLPCLCFFVVKLSHNLVSCV